MLAETGPPPSNTQNSQYPALSTLHGKIRWPPHLFLHQGLTVQSTLRLTAHIKENFTVQSTV